MEAVTLGTVVRAPSIVRSEVRQDGVCLVTLDDPHEAHNTITPQLGAELTAAFEAAESDPRVKAIVLASGKKDSFLVGANIDYLRAMRFAKDAEEASREVAKRFARFAASPKPVVACVHGAALGGGFELALACAATLATNDPKTVLGLPEVKLGLMPAANGLLRVAERAGLRVAIDLGLTGRSLKAKKAFGLGLVDEIVPPDEAVLAACALALRIAARPELRTILRTTRGKQVERMLVEKNPIGRAVLFRRARDEAATKTRGHYPATERMLDVLACFGSRGFRAAAALEATLFGELVVSETSHRLVELFFAQAAAKKDPAGAAHDGAFATRILGPYLAEALQLVGEGVPPDVVDASLVDWGFPKGPLEVLREQGTPAPKAAAARELAPRTKPMPDEISLRCTLALVNEALRCAADGTLRSPRDGDLAAIFGIGFPAFRGGPFRYVDVLGAPEVLRRTRSLEQRLGARFEPAPLLVEMARKGKRFYG